MTENDIDFSREVELLGSAEWNVRSRAFESLQCGGAATIDALIAGTNHHDWRLRRGCADLMDHLADNRCTESLVRLLSDPVAAVRRLAMHALSCQGCKACPLDVDIVGLLIQTVTSDSSIRVRRAAVHQLGCQPPDSRAYQLLSTLLNDEIDPGMRSRAEWSLSKHQTRPL